MNSYTEYKLKKNYDYYASNREDMLSFVPKESHKILDVGCGEGNFASLLKVDKVVEVWGVELDEVAGKIAQTKLDKVVIGDFQSSFNELPNKYFDCIIFNDVLEHLTDPYNELELTKELLSDNGSILCSIPNVRHYSVLFELLIKKDWEYKASGILDYTHLRFYTEKSIKRMFNSLDYKIVKMEGISATNSFKYKLINMLTFGFMSDTKYLKFACVIKNK